jgi:hypothetical protein
LPFCNSDQEASLAGARRLGMPEARRHPCRLRIFGVATFEPS